MMEGEVVLRWLGLPLRLALGMWAILWLLFLSLLNPKRWWDFSEDMQGVAHWIWVG